MMFKAFAKICARVTLNRASTINIKVREKLKNITVGNTLSDGDKFLFVLHMSFAAPSFADILFVQLRNARQITRNRCHGPTRKISARKLNFLAFFGAAVPCYPCLAFIADVLHRGYKYFLNGSKSLLFT